MKKVLLFFLILLVFYKNITGESEFYPTPNAHIIPEKGFVIIPETERPLNFIILGADKRGFLTIENKKNNKQIKEIEKELWMLAFELEHGRIINNLPLYTKIYFAFSEEKEKDFFKEYLIKKCGFNDNLIKSRVKFLKVKEPTLWTQDAGEILGRNEKGKIILLKNNDSYSFLLSSLFKFYKDDFIIKEINELSVEGGDIEIAWDVNRKGTVILIGRHRVIYYFFKKEGIDYKDIALTQEKIEEVKEKYREIFSTKIKILPEKILKQPSLAQNELFHLDMVVTILSDKEKVYAFVPIYEKIEGNYDIVLKNYLKPDFVKKCNTEYNIVAEELKEEGFEVMRIPIYDHPVRSPVNIIKFIDKETEKPTIMLGKYPYFDPQQGIVNDPYYILENLIFKLDDKLKIFEKQITDNNFSEVMASISNIWQFISFVYKNKNPYFEKQKEIYEKNGFKVVEVPIFASGSGGLHCTAIY